MIMDGPRLRDLPVGAFDDYREDPATANAQDLRVIGEGYYPIRPNTPATDDWPFIYLVGKSFPSIYIAGLAVVALLSLVGIGAIAPRRTLQPSAHARTNESSTAARRPPCFLFANASTSDSYDGERGGQGTNGLHVMCPFGLTQHARRSVIAGRRLFAGQTFASIRRTDLLCGQLASRA